MGDLFKVLNADGSAYHGGLGSWPLPTDDGPGEWVEVDGPLVPCRNGLHLCRPGDVLGWIGPAIFTAEYDGERIDCGDKIVVRRARLLARTRWDREAAIGFACDCAERVLPIFEAWAPGDDRPREAIEAARAGAAGAAGAAWAAEAARAAGSAWAAGAAEAAWAAWAAGSAWAAGAAWAAWAAGAAEAARAAEAAWAAEHGWQIERLLGLLDG